jgi:hypothetical protein
MARRGFLMAATICIAMAANSRAQTGNEVNAIRLMKPANGSTTEPLQEFKWPEKINPAGSSERSLPRPVSFAWEAPSAESKGTVYNLLISRNADLSEPLVRGDLSNPACDVLHLFIGTRYYWKVTAKTPEGRVPGESPVWTLMTNDTPPRWIRVPGMSNVRDIGGWLLPGKRRVRQGLIYRSSAMNVNFKITEEGKQVLISELKIRTDLDLRGHLGDAGCPALDPTAVKWLNIPVKPYAGITMPEERAEYRKVFQSFADPTNYPIMFHCAVGADRTGTVAFLLHGLLGMSMEDCIRDYELTTLSTVGVRTRTSADFQGFLKALREFGGPADDLAGQVGGYLRSIGVTAEEMAAIRRLLIEDVPDNRSGARTRDLRARPLAWETLVMCRMGG